MGLFSQENRIGDQSGPNILLMKALVRSLSSGLLVAAAGSYPDDSVDGVTTRYPSPGVPPET